MFLTKLLMTSVIICYLIDFSGIIQTIKNIIWKTLFKKQGNPNNIKLKPFDCTLCSIWWAGIILMIVTKEFTLMNLMITALISFMSKHISEILSIVSEIFVLIENKIMNLINR